MILQRTYNANMKVVVPFLLQQYGQRHSMKMEMETPEQKKWMLEVGIHEQGINNATADLTFRSVNDKIIHLTVRDSKAAFTCLSKLDPLSKLMLCF